MKAGISSHDLGKSNVLKTAFLELSFPISEPLPECNVIILIQITLYTLPNSSKFQTLTFGIRVHPNGPKLSASIQDQEEEELIEIT